MPTTQLPSLHEGLIQFLYRAPIGLLQTNVAGEILMINPEAARHLMPLAPTGNLVNLFDVLAPVLPDLRARVAGAGAEPGTVLCEDLRFTLPGAGRGATPRTLSLGLQRVEADLLMGSLSDVTAAVAEEQRRLQTELHDAARLDTLTGLPNRLALLERLEELHRGAGAAPAGVLALLYLNVDRFSAVNVAHGTHAGDQLLCQISERLRRLLRPGDALARTGGPLAAHLGGDEFAVCVQSLPDEAAAVEIARRLIGSLTRPFGIHGVRLQVGVRVGIALAAPPAEMDPQSLLQDARIAMREAPRGGERLAVFEPGMKARAAARGSLEQDLRRAITRREIELAYQPIVRLDGQQGAGFEALARWRHPQRGWVPPGEFIPVAEDCGLIEPLGALVLEMACTQYGRWQRAWGADAPSVLSVNLSRGQLADRGLVEQVRALLQATRMPPPRLQLEITESMAGQDAVLHERLPALKALGVTLALDDFGTGYSSLACLHQMPVDVVKIDRSFVSQAETSAHHRVLIDATVRVARSLRMGTVAEGVETAGQAAILRTLGCEKGQGFLFAQPLAMDDATRWWSRQPALALHGEARSSGT